MDDNTSKAVSTVHLNKPDVKVKGRSSSQLIIDIAYNHETKIVPGTESTTYTTCNKLHILFSNGSDLANFLRSTTEFTSQPTQTLDRGYKAPPKSNKSPQRQETHVRQENMGNTKDILSSTYGL